VETIKHLIECHCILPIFKNRTPVIYHKFAVFSKIDKNDKVIPKYVNCNNCGVVHFVTEICKSDIKIGKEDIGSIRTKEDIKLSLPEKIINVLDGSNCTVDLYEETEFILENQTFPRELILKREIINEEHHLKILEIKDNNNFKIKSETISTIIK